MLKEEAVYESPSSDNAVAGTLAPGSPGSSRERSAWPGGGATWGQLQQLQGPSGSRQYPQDTQRLTAPLTLFNTGVYAIQSNNATLALVEQWLSLRGKDVDANDQVR